MRTGKDRVQLEDINIAVSIGDARVEPGDIMLGDADGVLVIPKAHEDGIIKLAEEIDAAEENILEAIASGLRLDEAREKFKYHQLQRQEEAGDEG